MELVAGNVKAAMKTAGATSADLWKVPVDQIHVLDGFNVRVTGDEYNSHIELLAESIRANGFRQDKPLAGYVAEKDGAEVIYLTDGHSRLTAVKLLINSGMEFSSLPVVVSPRGTTMEDLVVGLVTSNSGKPLTPYELGLVCKRLIDMGMEEKTIASRLTITTGYVKQLLDLVGSPKQLRDMVTSGRVSATTAMETIKKHGVAKAAEKLDAGIKLANASGKKRASAKHIDGPRKVTQREALKLCIEYFMGLERRGFELREDAKIAYKAAKEAL
jgi:ParB family chromosome partitioning protein